MFLCFQNSWGNAIGVLINSKWAKRTVCLLVRIVSINHYYVKRTCAFGRLIVHPLLFTFRSCIAFFVTLGLKRPWLRLLLSLCIVLFCFVHVDFMVKTEIWMCSVLRRAQQKYLHVISIFSPYSFKSSWIYFAFELILYARYFHIWIEK